MAEEGVSELEDESTETPQTEMQREKKNEKRKKIEHQRTEAQLQKV